MDIDKLIANYAYRYCGDWSKISNAIKNKEWVDSYDIQESYITYFSQEYPESLKELRFPPWILFYKGDITLLNKPSISIVGSRQMSSYGEQMTRCIAINKVKKYVLVSGLAKGVDATVHKVGIRHGKTIGIIGCGLDTQYPSCNSNLYKEMEENHLIISEYPRFVGVRKHHFPWRNRIIAALSDELVVTQARIHSGTMLTVNEAVSLSKDIYCVPYALNDCEGEGCNLLISQGAQIITNIVQS